jgi:CheY-like chemotaxis protein
VEAAEEAIQLMRPLAADRNITIQTSWPSEAETQHIVADRQRLGQVLLNLISNAVKYNVEGGTVTVDCELASDGLVRIGVADTGQGVAADKLPLLFTPFERLGAEQTETEGTGLGLALSKSLVEAMGGRLLVETVVGAGTKFWIELPATTDPASGPAGPEAFHGGGSDPDVVASGTLLYIEDNLSNLKLIEAVLERRPCVDLISAMTAGLGIELAHSHLPDLILLDLHLPDESGEEVLRRLRKDLRTAAIPVVIASADATPGRARSLLAGGATDYLTKPIDVGALLDIIDRLLGPRTEARP